MRNWIKRKIATIKWRNFLADTIARVIFSFATGMVIEMGFAGMSLTRSLISRLIAQPTTAATARFYGRFNDWGLNKIGLKKKHFENKWLNRTIYGLKFFFGNTLMYVIFYCTQYALIRYFIVGATYEETKIATISLGALSVLLGVIYRLWLQLVRKIFRVKPEESKEEKSSPHGQTPDALPSK